VDYAYRAIGFGGAGEECPEEGRCVDVAVTFDEVGGATVVAHRPGRNQIIQFLADEV